MSSYAYSSTASSSTSGVLIILLFIVAIVVLVAWLVATEMFIDLAQKKDPQFYRTGMLWFVGIFATPIVVGLYVCAMTDKRSATSSANNRNDADALNGELPSI